MAEEEVVETSEESQGTEESAKETVTETETAPVDWRSLITDAEAKKEAERTTDLDAAFRRIGDLRKELSTAIKVPGKDAPDTEVAAYHKAIGVPEAADAYEFPALPDEQLTDDVKAFRADWAETFHSLKIPKDAAETLAQKFHEQSESAKEAVAEADKKFADEQTEALKQKWAADFDRNKELARRAVENLATKAGIDTKALLGVEMKDGRFLLDSAEILQVFATAGSGMQEGTLGDDLTGADRDNMESQIADLRQKASEAQSRGDHKAANKFYQQEQDLLNRMGGQRAA